MLRPYDLLENILIDIEKGIGEGVNADILAQKYSLSEGHLRRLFRFAFNQTLAGYIRSRKLAASLDVLLKTDAKLLDIALDYGFLYEQPYINAFKREFGLTPGSLRKSGRIVKVKPPLHLFDVNKFPDGLFFYIGQHHYLEINRNVARSMYEAIGKFTHVEHSKYKLLNDKVYFERIDSSLYDGTYCQMEWYAPVEER